MNLRKEDPGFDPAAVPVRDAATVMLVRDAAEGIEVFMLRRTLGAAFAAGAYVFPGGAVDPVDGTAEVEALCVGRTDADASALLGVARGGLAYWVASVRECFEEAGVLLAVHDDGTVVRFDEQGGSLARFAAHREALNGRRTTLVDIVRAEGLRLATGDMHYVSHWITPVGEARRFDTRFFVTAAPAVQEPLHDDNETVASLWVAPGEALERAAAGELLMIPPTVANIGYLARFATVAELLADAATITAPPVIQPRLVTEDGKVVAVLLPGDPGFDEAR
jgi:8-oxo-dGTP pyrophosphatase MutT (NUDIX family)